MCGRDWMEIISLNYQLQAQGLLFIPVTFLSSASHRKSWPTRSGPGCLQKSHKDSPNVDTCCVTQIPLQNPRTRPLSCQESCQLEGAIHQPSSRVSQPKRAAARPLSQVVWCLGRQAYPDLAPCPSPGQLCVGVS